MPRNIRTALIIVVCLVVGVIFIKKFFTGLVYVMMFLVVVAVMLYVAFRFWWGQRGNP